MYPSSESVDYLRFSQLHLPLLRPFRPNLLSLSGCHALHLAYAFASTIRAFRDCSSLALNGSALAKGLQPQTDSSHFPASRNKRESSASVSCV